MESFRTENLSFSYRGREMKALDNISISVPCGEFVTLCGKSGCGKTTLLRLLKSTIAPNGDVSGDIYFCGRRLSEYDEREQAGEIGFVMQSPDNQLVTDKVWHELAFGLESMGVPTPEIRAKVAEMASFFGIEEWFHKKVDELSGGQKQLLNLASVMVMQPSALLLDEPTSQLDPIAAQEFLKTLEKINRELGTTVIITEHRLEEVLPISDRVIVLDGGKVIADGTPEKVGKSLKESGHDMYLALPTPMRVYGAVDGGKECPLTVREGRSWLESYAKDNTLCPELIPIPNKEPVSQTAVEVKDAWFRYEKDLPDVIKGLDITIKKGELFAIVGGNGSGKTTLLSLISGLGKPYSGKVLINGVPISDIHSLYSGLLGVLPQNPQSLFVRNTVFSDLMDMLSERKLSREEKEKAVEDVAALCHIETLLGSHPYDLSGGEQQRAALAKVLLLSPEILLLDEPTKGFDAHFKRIFADIINDLKASGKTVIMVSHDIEFCAEYADRCAMLFDGIITSEDAPREFFKGKSFYTTAANRMARKTLPDAVLAEDIILACGGKTDRRERAEKSVKLPEKETPIKEKPRKKLSLPRLLAGSVFAVLFVLTSLVFTADTDLLHLTEITWLDSNYLQIISLAEIALALACFLPQRELVSKPAEHGRKVSMRSIIAMLFVLVAVPVTIYVGIRFFGDRRYYLISLLIILETMLPFFALFESRKPKAREIVVVSVLCAVAIAGRVAFSVLPQFKPVVALVIISGVCFGGETGFLVGAVTAFVSNFFFGQGPWTPWQMFALGMVGFVAGLLFGKGFIKRTRLSLCIFGFVAVFAIYGGITNPSFVIQSQTMPTLDMIIASIAAGAPFDLVHAVSTVFFLWFISEPMAEKIDRIKTKYGIFEK